MRQISGGIFQTYDIIYIFYQMCDGLRIQSTACSGNEIFDPNHPDTFFEPV